MGMGNPCPGCTVAPTVWPTRLGPLKTCNRTAAMTESKDRTRFAKRGNHLRSDVRLQSRIRSRKLDDT